MANRVDPDETVSFRSKLLAQVSVLVCQAERIKGINTRSGSEKSNYVNIKKNILLLKERISSSWKQIRPF